MLVDSQQDAADGFGVEPSAPKGARHAGQGHVPLAIPYWAAQYVSRDRAAVGRVDPDVDVAWQSFRHLREIFKPVAQVRMKAFYDNRTRLAVLPVVRPGHPEDPGAIVDGIAAEPLGNPAHNVLGAVQLFRAFSGLLQQELWMPAAAGPHQDRWVMGQLQELLYAALAGVAVLYVEVRPESPEASDSYLGAILTEPEGRACVDFMVTTEPDSIPGCLCWGRIEPPVHGLAFAGEFVANLYSLFCG
jgi:hypothetical protein